MARILVAGRDATELKARALLIEFEGHGCITARSLEEALETVENAPIDLVIADIELLNSYSSGTAEIMRRCSARAALMVLTDKPGSIVQADAILNTPCSPEEFFTAIQNVLDNSHAKVEGVGTPRHAKV